MHDKLSRPGGFATLALTLALCACGGGGGGTGGSGAGGASSAAGSGGEVGGSASVSGSGGGEGGSGQTTSGTTTGGSLSTGGSGGAAGDDLSALSDELDDSASLADWTLLHEELNEPVPYDALDIDGSAPGKLTILPKVSAWYQGDHATFLYKQVTGDFVVEVDAAAYQKGTLADPPTSEFNSAGLLVRDPSSGPGAENWLMYNIGYQQSFLGVEGKATVASQSELILIPSGGPHEARLRLCRIGNTVRMLRRFAGDSGWTETHMFPDTFTQTADYTLPATVQVGFIDNAYTFAGVRAEFEYIRFARVDTPADCTAD